MPNKRISELDESGPLYSSEVGFNYSQTQPSGYQAGDEWYLMLAKPKISNEKIAYSNFRKSILTDSVNLQGNQKISGVKTFSDPCTLKKRTYVTSIVDPSSSGDISGYNFVGQTGYFKEIIAGDTGNLTGSGYSLQTNSLYVEGDIIISQDFESSESFTNLQNFECNEMSGFSSATLKSGINISGDMSILGNLSQNSGDINLKQNIHFNDLDFLFYDTGILASGSNEIFIDILNDEHVKISDSLTAGKNLIVSNGINSGSLSADGDAYIHKATSNSGEFLAGNEESVVFKTLLNSGQNQYTIPFPKTFHEPPIISTNIENGFDLNSGDPQEYIQDLERDIIIPIQDINITGSGIFSKKSLLGDHENQLTVNLPSIDWSGEGTYTVGEFSNLDDTQDGIGGVTIEYWILYNGLGTSFGGGLDFLLEDDDEIEIHAEGTVNRFGNVPIAGLPEEAQWHHFAIYLFRDDINIPVGGITMWRNGSRIIHKWFPGTSSTYNTNNINRLRVGKWAGTEDSAGIRTGNILVDSMKITQADKYGRSNETITVPSEPFELEQDTISLIRYENNINPFSISNITERDYQIKFDKKIKHNQCSIHTSAMSKSSSEVSSNQNIQRFNSTLTAGQTSYDISFPQERSEAPFVNASINGLDDSVQYAISGVNTQGYKLFLESSASNDFEVNTIITEKPKQRIS